VAELLTAARARELADRLKIVTADGATSATAIDTVVALRSHADALDAAESGCEIPDFERELAALLNRYSRENGSNTADWVLATFLHDVLNAFDSSVRLRETGAARLPTVQNAEQAHANALDAGATHPAPSAVEWLAKYVGAEVHAIEQSDALERGVLVLAATDGVVREVMRSGQHVTYDVALHGSPLVYRVSVVEAKAS
jgi:hypothetical protein